MPWRSMTPVVCAVANTPYPIDDDPKNVHALFFQQHWSNTGRMYIGDASNMSPTATPPTSLVGYLQPPAVDTTSPSFTLGEQNAPNGVSTGDLWVASSQAGDTVILSYYES